MTEQQEKLFRADPFVQLCIEKKVSVDLVGGAVVDILREKRPKDYDIMSCYHIDKLGLSYEYDTKTSTTYSKGEITVQVLKRMKEEFDFTISKATLKIDTMGKLALYMDEKSFNNKILVPTDIAWQVKGNARNSLSRVKHWEKKGYHIHEKTYKSLRKVAKLSLFDRVKEFFSDSENS